MNRVAIDTETTGLFPFLGDRPFAISQSDEKLKTGFWRTGVNPFTREVSWKGMLGPWKDLENKKLGKVFHNGKFDCRMLEMIGHPVQGRIDDTMIIARVLFSDEEVGLKELGEKWLEVDKKDEEELGVATKQARDEIKAQNKGWLLADDSGRWGNKEIWKADYWVAPQRLLENYSRLDAERTMLLFHLLDPMLDADPRLRRRYEEEMELFTVVYRMESRGVRCSRSVCRFENAKAEMRRKFHYARLQRGLKEIGFSTKKKVLAPAGSGRKWQELESHDINVDSGVQIAKLVYDKLGFPIKHYTDKGNPATDATALREMNHPVVNDIISVKAQLKTQEFFDGYLMQTRPDEDGVEILHPNFQQLGARTGRFSCRSPNLQNVPDAFNTRGFEPIQARMPFGPRPGKIWLHIDYSQIEMWIFAGEAGDQALLADLHTGNLHTATANRVYGKGRDIVAEEAKEHRKNSRGRAKMLNFGVVFCMGKDSMAAALQCSRAEAEQNLNFYYEQYHRIRPFMENMISLAGRQGFIWNRFGWKLQVSKRAPYRSVNYIVQSSAAAHMKAKMVWMDNYYRAHPEIGAYIVLTIHDEIVTEVEESKIIPHIPIIKKELEDHRGIWSEFPCLPIDFKITRERWDRPEKPEWKF